MARISQVSVEERDLVRLLHRIGFGSIEGLRIVDGKPVLDPQPKITREILLKAASDSKQPSADYELKSQVLALLQHIRQIDHGTIHRLEIQGGLPFRLVLEGVRDE